MRSAIFYGMHDLRVEESEKPVIKEDEVLIRVKACGVCGTDVHIYEGHKGAAEVTPPTILGHEFAGVIEAAGSYVTGFKPGDRVCIDPNCYCGSCNPCRSGKAHFCEHMVGYGTTVNGGFAEYCKAKASQVYRLGENTTFEQGAMAEPLACCLHGIDMCEIQPGYQVVVVGGGMIGLLMVQLAKLEGAAKIVLLEPVENKRQMGRRLGADVCIDPAAQDVKTELELSGITDINVVIECVGRPSTIQEAIEIAGNKAVVMMFGLTAPDEKIQVEPYMIFRKELTLKSSYINPYTQKRALELIDSGKIDVESMVCDTCGLEMLEEILKNPQIRARGKYIISPETV
ncbi:MAG: zinc-dependent alcohol dehydrogenase family protein [Clostridiales bacterium]|nr:zinc-dependent alcohol dehydrogenase family protein [Clostridiales bacterium]